MPDPIEHQSISRFRAAWFSAGGTGRIVVLPESVHTAALAARALGCEIGAIANSLLFDSGNGPILILTSGAHRVDTAKVAANIGVARLRRASADFVREHTGPIIWGVSPLDNPPPIPTYGDRALKHYREICSEIGRMQFTACPPLGTQ